MSINEADIYKVTHGDTTYKLYDKFRNFSCSITHKRSHNSRYGNRYWKGYRAYTYKNKLVWVKITDDDLKIKTPTSSSEIDIFTHIMEMGK